MRIHHQRILGSLALVLGLALPSLAMQETTSPQDAAKPEAAKGGAKDLFFRQMSAPQSALGYGLQYAIELTRAGKVSTVSSSFPFVSGDQIRFRVRSSIDGYMYILLTEGSTGDKAVLFPLPDSPENNKVVHGSEMILPANGTLEFDDKPGIENLQLLLSRQPLPEDPFAGFSRQIVIHAKSAILSPECYCDTPPSLQAGTTKSSEFATLATSEIARPLAVALVLEHEPRTSPKKADDVTTVDHAQDGLERATRPETEKSGSPAKDQVLTDTAVKDKWALIVGINHFKPLSPNGAHVNSLLFADKDARDFSSFLIGEEHFAPDHVKVLLNEQATRDRILSESADNGWLPKNVKEGDLVVIYIASHATAAQDSSHKKSYLVAYDTDPFQAATTGVELEGLAKFVKEGLHSNRVMFVLDTCHAGSAKALAQSVPLLEAFQGTGHLVLAASRPDQVSYDSVQFQNGLFTHCLIDSLRNSKNLDEAFLQTQTEVEKQSQLEYHHMQSPMLKKDEWVGQLPILSATPTDPHPAVTP